MVSLLQPAPIMDAERELQKQERVEHSIAYKASRYEAGLSFNDICTETETSFILEATKDLRSLTMQTMKLTEENRQQSRALKYQQHLSDKKDIQETANVIRIRGFDVKMKMRERHEYVVYIVQKLQLAKRDVRDISHTNPFSDKSSPTTEITLRNPAKAKHFIWAANDQPELFAAQGGWPQLNYDMKESE